MVLLDVNVLVAAMRTDSPRHDVMFGAITELRESHEPFALCDPVLSGTLRVLTHPGIYKPPTPMHRAIKFVEVLRHSANAVVIHPGPRHWSLFLDIVNALPVGGNLVSDAWIGALAIEHGCEVLTDDVDFARLPGVRFRTP
jgi:hypothetical protein